MPAALWREEGEVNITIWTVRAQVIASVASQVLKCILHQEILKTRHTERNTAPLLFLLLSLLVKLPCVPSFCMCWCLCWSPNRQEMAARGTQWQKKFTPAVPTWSTLVMLNLLVAYPLSLLWDLCVTFRTLSYFSLLICFHCAEWWILRSGNTANSTQDLPASLEFRHPFQAINSSDLFSLFREEYIQSWMFYYMPKQKVH